MTLILETKIHKVAQGDLEPSFVAQAGLLSDPLPLASGVAGIIGLPLPSCFGFFFFPQDLSFFPTIWDTTYLEAHGPFVNFDPYEQKTQVSEMARQMRAVGAKFGNLSSKPRSHVVE